jgi:hypothetical protein
MPIVPPRQAAFRTRRTWLLAKLATSVTVLTAATAVVIVAAAAVAFTITWGAAAGLSSPADDPVGTSGSSLHHHDPPLCGHGRRVGANDRRCTGNSEGATAALLRQ